MTPNSGELIIEQFQKLLVNSPVDSSNLELLSDENVKSYVVSTITQLFEEYEDHKLWIDNDIESAFDVETFIEILDAYFEGIRDIHKKDIFEWLIQLKKAIDSSELIQREANFETLAEHDKEVLTQLVADEKCEKITTKKVNKQANPDIENLLEMFPSMSLNTIEKFYKNYGYDYDRTLDNILLSYDKLASTDWNDDTKNRDHELKEEEKRKIKEETVKRLKKSFIYSILKHQLFICKNNFRYGLVKTSEGSKGIKSPIDHPIPLWVKFE